MKSPIQQAKDHILNVCLPLVEPQHEIMVIPCYRQDYGDYQKALELPEVRSAIQAKGVKAKFLIVGKNGNPEPQIVIATIKDAANGTLDRYLQGLD